MHMNVVPVRSIKLSDSKSFNCIKLIGSGKAIYSVEKPKNDLILQGLNLQLYGNLVVAHRVIIRCMLFIKCTKSNWNT